MIIADGLRRMVAEQDILPHADEQVQHPALPDSTEAGILKGMYLLRPASRFAAGAGSGEPVVPVLCCCYSFRRIVFITVGPTRPGRILHPRV